MHPLFMKGPLASMSIGRCIDAEFTAGPLRHLFIPSCSRMRFRDQACSLRLLPSLFNSLDGPFWLRNQVKRRTWTTSRSSELTVVYYTGIPRMEPFGLYTIILEECPIT